MENSNNQTPIMEVITKFLIGIAYFFSKENIKRLKDFIALRKKAKPHLNTLVISVLEIKRLKGVIDGEDDFYWEYETEKGEELASCVMGFIPLKGALPDSDYEEI